MIGKRQSDVGCGRSGVGLGVDVGLGTSVAVALGTGAKDGLGAVVGDAVAVSVGTLVGFGVRVAKATTDIQAGSTLASQSLVQRSTIRRGKAQSPFRRTVTSVSHGGEVG